MSLRRADQNLSSAPGFEEVKFARDSPLEEDGFELAVPPRRERLWGATPGKHRRLGPEPVSGSAFRAAVSDWQRPEEPFAGAGPMIRIRFPPAANRANFQLRRRLVLGPSHRRGMQTRSSRKISMAGRQANPRRSHGRSREIPPRGDCAGPARQWSAMSSRARASRASTSTPTRATRSTASPAS
jgi:hypothetical protein